MLEIYFVFPTIQYSNHKSLIGQLSIYLFITDRFSLPAMLYPINQRHDSHGSIGCQAGRSPRYQVDSPSACPLQNHHSYYIYQNHCFLATPSPFMLLLRSSSFRAPCTLARWPQCCAPQSLRLSTKGTPKIKGSVLYQQAAIPPLYPPRNARSITTTHIR